MKLIRVSLLVTLFFIGVFPLLSGCTNAVQLPGVFGNRPSGGIEPLIVRQIPSQQVEFIEAEPGSGPLIEQGQRAMIAILAPLEAEQQNIRNLARHLVQSARLVAHDVEGSGIELRSYDTRGSVTGARLAAEQAISDGAALILGPFFSASVATVREAAELANVNVIGFSNDMRVAGGNTYLIGFMPTNEVQRIFEFAVSKGLGQMAVMVPNSQYGELVISASRQMAAITGATISHVERYNRTGQGIQAGAKSFATYYEDIPLSQRPQALLIADNGEGLKAMASYLDYNRVSPKTVKFMGLGAWYDDLTLEERALRGGWFAAPDVRIHSEFEKRYMAMFNQDPLILGTLGFDAMAVAAALYADGQQSGNQYPFSTQEITRPQGFEGINGVLRFIANGLNERQLAVLEVRNGEFVTVSPAEDAFWEEFIDKELEQIPAEGTS